MTIHVTQDDINRGVKGSCFYCPVAHAINRAINFSDQVEVDEASVTFKAANVWRDLPPEVSEWIRKFDTEGLDAPEVAPFTFELDIP